MLLKKAEMDEANSSYQCIEDARVYHNSMGFVQWHPGYPTLATAFWHSPVPRARNPSKDGGSRASPDNSAHSVPQSARH